MQTTPHCMGWWPEMIVNAIAKMPKLGHGAVAALLLAELSVAAVAAPLTTQVPPGLVAPIGQSALCNPTGSSASPIGCTPSQNTALINPATTSLPGALPAWPNASAIGNPLLGTGAVSQPVSAILTQLATVSGFNTACNGSTDDGPNIQKALNEFGFVYLSDNGCSGAYVINTTVSAPANESIIGFASGFGGHVTIATTGAVSTFQSTGDHVSYSGLKIMHSGSAGYGIDCGIYNWCALRDIEAWGVNATDASAILHTRGAQTLFDHVRVVNCRPNAYGIDIDGSSSPAIFSATINPIISNSIVFSSSQSSVCGDSLVGGKGVHIWSSDNTARPEGVVIASSFIDMESSINLELEQVFGFDSVAVTYDSASTTSIDLTPTGEGIQSVNFIGGYIATPLNGSVGVCVRDNTSGTAPISQINIRGVQFGICGYGVVFVAANPTVAFDLSIDDNKFIDIGGTAIDVQNWPTAHISGNTVRTTAQNLALVDGESGGPYWVDGNSWESSASMTITETMPTNFHFGQGNTGTILAGYAAATTGTISATGCTALAIPISTPIAPNLDKITLGARVVTGSFSNVAAVISSVTTSDINVSVCETLGTSGTIRIAANFSL
jgi:hypothetical protein